MTDFMAIGRTRSGSPARYISWGYALYVSAQDNELGVAEWRGEDPTAENFPLPTKQECEGAKPAVFKLAACAESRRQIMEVLAEKNAELDSIDSALREFSGGDEDTAYARVLRLQGLYIRLQGWQKKLLEMLKGAQDDV